MILAIQAKNTVDDATMMAKILPPPSAKPEFVRRGFDSIASNYDRLNDLMTFGLHRGWKREAIRRLALRPGMNVLDVCAGTGDLSFRALEATGQTGHVSALDFSFEMMRKGKDRAARSNRDTTASLSWLCADANRLPFADRTFDGAVVGFGLRNLVAIEPVLREVYRVLKPGRWFINLDTAPAEWKCLMPLYRLHMNIVVPLLGRWFAGSKEMYSYLAASSAAFQPPDELRERFEHCGFVETGFAYCPRFIGGAALVWGKRKPE